MEVVPLILPPSLSLTPRTAFALKEMDRDRSSSHVSYPRPPSHRAPHLPSTRRIEIEAAPTYSILPHTTRAFFALSPSPALWCSLQRRFST